MRYHGMTKFDTANGPGIRTTLWISGCTHRCKGCHNPQTWDFESGEEFTHETERELIESIAPDYIAGVTFSGGDPLNPNNLFYVMNIIHDIRVLLPNKSIWIYTGYTWEELQTLLKSFDHQILQNILSYIDVLVDGKFEIDKRDISLPYCGSTNQRVIDVQKSLASRKVVLYES